MYIVHWVMLWPKKYEAYEGPSDGGGAAWEGSTGITWDIINDKNEKQWVAVRSEIQ